MSQKLLSWIVIGLILIGPLLAKITSLNEINFISAFYYALLIIFGILMLRNFKPRSWRFWAYLAGYLAFALFLILYYII